MNLRKKISKLDINDKFLTKKKEQTNKKIEYVKKYVELWALVMLERDEIDTINFFDCMCNAGIYKDGDYCTAIEVLLIFYELCDKYPQKKCYVWFNDIDKNKIRILRDIIEKIPEKQNLNVKINNCDVNSYLEKLCENPIIDNKQIFRFGSANIIYVDPFNFGTVQIPKISAILEKYYCELIFNFFISDYVRNIKNDKGRISKCLGGKKISSKDELISYIRCQLKVGNIRYLFTYQFKTQKNVELYQIIFASPNIYGLKKLKEVLWDVFDGAEFHKNHIEKYSDQVSFFDNVDYKQKILLSSYSCEAINLLKNKFCGKEVSWREIESFLIENTMLKESQIINYVLNPMIKSNQIEKCGFVRKNNYKQDYYIFKSKGVSDDTKNVDI